MIPISRAAVLAVAFTLLLAFRVPCMADGAGPRAGALSIAMISPANGSTVSGDVNITGNASGPEGATLSVNLSIDGGPWYPVNGNASWFWLWGTGATPAGAHRLSAEVSDGTDEANTSITVLVENSVTMPRINGSYPPSDLPPLYPGATLTFTISIEGDYTGDINWSVDGNDVQNVTGRVFTFVAGAEQIGNDSVEVRLATGDPSPVRWNLTVLPPNLPPVIAGFSPNDHNFSAYQDDSIHFNVTASDPEGHGLTYRWSVDSGQALENRTGESVDLSFCSTGTHTVEVFISDGQANATVSWNVTVQQTPELGLLDLLPCLVYIVLGLLLGVWFGRRRALQWARGVRRGDEAPPSSPVP